VRGAKEEGRVCPSTPVLRSSLRSATTKAAEADGNVQRGINMDEQDGQDESKSLSLFFIMCIHVKLVLAPLLAAGNLVLV
jgi:hypothetical protein